MPSSKLVLSFRLFRNGQLIREETLAQSVIKIGKVPSAHLQIADEAVSRMHAIIEVTGRDVSLIDLGSTRGSFVNDKRVNKARLVSGDVLTLGDTRIEFAIRDAEAAPTASVGDRPPATADAARRPPPLPAVVSGVIEAAPAAPPAVPAPAPMLLPTAVTEPSNTAPGLVLAPVVAAEPLPGVAAPPVVPVAGPAFLAAVPDDPGTAAAVEIAAMLGDSVVGVKHCIDPRSGRIMPATWGLVAGGAACLLASAIAFYASVATAAANHDRRETWTRIEHRPAYAFRPVRLGPAVDAVAFGGFGLAIVGIGLGIARMRRERVSPYYRIGTAPGVELAIDGAPAPAFPLVAPSGNDFVFHFAPGIDGELLQGGSATPLTQLAAAGRARPSASTPGAFEVAIPRHARIRARAGRATFLIAAVPRPRRQATPLLAGLQSRALVYVAGSLAAHLAIWGVLQLIPPDATTVPIEVPQSELIVGRIESTATEKLVPPPTEAPGEGGGETGGPRMALPEGASGDPSNPDHGRRRSIDAGPMLASSPSEAARAAREAGWLGNQLLADAIGEISARSDFERGFDALSVHGALDGDGDGGRGNFGAGRGGIGLGGGCGDEPCGLIPGGARYLTINDGPGAGGNYGLPGRGFGSGRHHPVLPTVGTPHVDGPGYDKTLIRRYIRRSIEKIAYCYNRQLLAHPGIEGEIAVQFFISPTGGVERSSGTGFDAEVAGCVADVIQAIAFPRPGDGVGVQVNYPFAFHAAGQ